MKLMDKLLSNVKFDKKHVLFSLIIVLFGIITGSIFVVILNTADKNLVIEYIQNFIDSVKGNFNYLDILKNTIINNYLTILLISIIGFTYFLVPINILILFYKAFIIGFSLSSLVLTYKFKGLILSTIYIFPHLIINILLISLLVSFTIKLSLNMIKSIVKKKDVNMRLYFNKYLHILILFILVITITSLYEAFAVPFILKLVTKIL